MSQGTSRHDLAGFLRSRRERITPAEVGLPAGARRRAPGLRREEVAVLAGLSPTWYIYLEQGRDIHPSVEVLDSLARVLALTEDERRYLHTLAHGNVRKPRPLDGEVPPEEIVARLVATADHSPYPVYGVNLYCDLIAWNHAATSYYADFAELAPERRNMLRWMLLDPQAKQRLSDWAADTQDVVARWRAMIANSADQTGRLHQLITEFQTGSPEFNRWWDGHDVREHRSRLRRFQHPRYGDRTLRLIVVQAQDFAPCIVIFHVPVDSTDSMVD